VTVPADTAQRLADARQRVDADDIAEALTLDANSMVQKGRFAEAQAELDEAAAIHRSRGREYDEACCRQFAATLSRFDGRLDEARARATEVLALVHRTGPIAVSALAELGEIAFTQGHFGEAADAYGASLEAGRATGLVDTARATLLRKRAVALANAAAYDDAVRDLDVAYGLLQATGDRAVATRVLIEKATALRHAGRHDEAERTARAAMDAAQQESDHAALADLHLFFAAVALERRDADTAMTAARTARQEALAANAPTSYIAAAVAMAKLAESQDDRAGSYEALAIGWATLGDLLGPDVARTTFEPLLRDARERWGAKAFDAIKAGYEATRRQAMTP
jgi:tetratricopeptide (TPR) repeat protein